MSNKTISYFVAIIDNTGKLNKRERDVLIKRVRGKTLQEIGKKYKVTGERIRQIEKVAVKKIMDKIHQMLLFEEQPFSLQEESLKKKTP